MLKWYYRIFEGNRPLSGPNNQTWFGNIPHFNENSNPPFDHTCYNNHTRYVVDIFNKSDNEEKSINIIKQVVKGSSESSRKYIASITDDNHTNRKIITWCDEHLLLNAYNGININSSYSDE